MNIRQSRSTNWFWLSLFFVMGVLLLVSAWWISQRNIAPPSANHRVAWIDREWGEVRILRTWNQQIEKVQDRGFVVPWDQVETQDGSQAKLSFETGDVLIVKPLSLISIEKWDEGKISRIKIVIKRGEIVVEIPGRSGELLIAKNGQTVSSALYGQSTLAQEEVKNPTSQELDPTNKNPQAPRGLSEAEITAVLTSSKPAFFKCYTQLLQKKPQAQGEVTLSLTIENSGKVNFSQVTSKNLSDEVFQNCLKDVAQRLSFRSFSGSPVSTLFPIRFE